jgi:hypothetical protein
MRSDHHVQHAERFAEPLELRTHSSVGVCHLTVRRKDIRSPRETLSQPGGATNLQGPSVDSNALQVLFVEPEQMRHMKPPAAIES